MLVPRVVPSTISVAPISGTPSVSRTVPVIFTSGRDLPAALRTNTTCAPRTETATSGIACAMTVSTEASVTSSETRREVSRSELLYTNV